VYETGYAIIPNNDKSNGTNHTGAILPFLLSIKPSLSNSFCLS